MDPYALPLRPSLTDLAGYADDRNTYRNFVRWVNKQPWRKALPQPDEPLALVFGFRASGVELLLRSSYDTHAEGTGPIEGPEKEEKRTTLRGLVARADAAQDASSWI